MVPWVEKLYVARRVCLSSFRALTSIQRVREGSPLSSPTGNPGSNGQRVAAVERLKAAVAERKVRDQKKAGARKRRLSWVDRDQE